MFREKIREKLTTLAPTGVGFDVSAGEGKFGDYATNLALVLAKPAGKDPAVVAQELIGQLQGDTGFLNYFERLEVAGPGFINFYLSERALNESLAEITEQKARFGYSDPGDKQKINIEFVSANPTGPLTLGNGRSAAYGEALTRLFKFFGHTVTKEYFLNDIGRQVRILGESVARKYLGQLTSGGEEMPKPAGVVQGETVDFPEEMYQGEYINDLAKEFADTKPANKDLASLAESAQQFAIPKMVEQIKHSLESFGVVHDVWFSEKSLQDNQEIEAVLKQLAKKNLSYEKDGALWFKAMQFGLDKDIVIRKSDGFTSYILSDFAYAINKAKRGYDQIIYILGADHHGDVARIKAGLQALGLAEEKFTLLIYQVVIFLDKGEKFKMSKRAGKFITLADLLAEVPADVIKFFFLMKSMDSQMDFDFALAKEESNKNPVYYVQYAYVRLLGVLRQAHEQGITGELAAYQWNEAEKNLLKTLARYPEILKDCLEDWQLHRLASFLLALAGTISRFYEVSRVIGAESAAAAKMRLILVEGSAIVLRNGLHLLGLTAPEQM